MIDIFYPRLAGITGNLHRELFNTSLNNYINNNYGLLCGCYDFDDRCFQHTMIWTPILYMISMLECAINNPNVFNNEDINILNRYLYQGHIYRVIKGKRVKYDNFICHCSYDMSDLNQSHRLNENENYTWIIADTNDSYGFNVNEYLKDNNIDNSLINFEHEIIFPITKKNVIKIFYGKYKDFIEYINN